MIEIGLQGWAIFNGAVILMLLLDLGVFQSEFMNEAIRTFKLVEDNALVYLGDRLQYVVGDPQSRRVESAIRFCIRFHPISVSCARPIVHPISSTMPVSSRH